MSSGARLIVIIAGLVVSTALSASVPAATQLAAGGGTAHARPRLLVLLVVDQMRADYVTSYGQQWTNGLHEIFTNGAYFSDAAYPYAGTKTCPGHATIGTGTVPSTHGMVDNEWYDVTSRAFVTCTEDASAESLQYPSGAGTEHQSGARLLVPTLAEQVVRQRGGRIVSLSGKARSAIGLAGGHGAASSVIVWQEEGGTWATSTGLTRARSQEVARFVAAHPTIALDGQVWNRSMPASTYQFGDVAPGEPAADNVFPHLFADPIRTSRTTQTSNEFWSRTPALDNYLGALAGTLVGDLHLGERSGIDVLAIGFSALDAVGHTYGPKSHEVQDTMARLDQTIGQLLALLDRRIGRDRYVLALSADHGVAQLPEQAAPGMGGRVASLLPVGTAVDSALRSVLGPGRYVEAIAGSYVYLRPGILDRIRSNAALVKTVETAVLGTPNIQRVYWSWDLASTTATQDALLMKLRKSHLSGRSGDLTVVLKPGWVLGAGANHGSPHDYDSRVPVAFLGAGIRAGRYASPATPVDIAPTLAQILGVRLGRTDGRVLADALAEPRQ